MKGEMMPDISMCRDSECPRAAECYRFTAKPSKGMQSYFAKSPRDKDTDWCSYFWKTEPTS